MELIRENWQLKLIQLLNIVSLLQTNACENCQNMKTIITISNAAFICHINTALFYLQPNYVKQLSQLFCKNPHKIKLQQQLT